MNSTTHPPTHTRNNDPHIHTSIQNETMPTLVPTTEPPHTTIPTPEPTEATPEPHRLPRIALLTPRLYTHAALNTYGFINLEIRKAIYGLPQAGILANKLLRQCLRPAGYYKVAHTPGIWRHITHP